MNNEQKVLQRTFKEPRINRRLVSKLSTVIHIILFSDSKGYTSKWVMESFFIISENHRNQVGDPKMYELPELWNMCRMAAHSETGPREKSLLLSATLGGKSYINPLSLDTEL